MIAAKNVLGASHKTNKRGLSLSELTSEIVCDRMSEHYEQKGGDRKYNNMILFTHCRHMQIRMVYLNFLLFQYTYKTELIRKYFLSHKKLERKFLFFPFFVFVFFMFSSKS